MKLSYGSYIFSFAIIQNNIYQTINSQPFWYYPMRMWMTTEENANLWITLAVFAVWRCGRKKNAKNLHLFGKQISTQFQTT